MSEHVTDFDAIIIGAGAAGLFCAGIAGQRGLKVLVLDHSPKVAEKVRISGGGRANFTNRDLDPKAPQKHYLSSNPKFCRSALSRYTPADFIALVQKHRIPFHEKHKGQLFCDESAGDLISMLLRECDAGGVQRWQPCGVKAVRKGGSGIFEVDTETKGTVRAKALVVATGGLSIPKIGATGFGFDLARQFGLSVVPTRPGLVPLTFDGGAWAPYADLAGIAMPVHIATGSKKERVGFDEDLLFTHRGLSGPGILQISSYWAPGTPIETNLVPQEPRLAEALAQSKQSSHKRLSNELAQWMPSRLAEAFAQQDEAWQRPVNECSDKALNRLAELVTRWPLTPTGTEGYAKAEVTVGGVDTKGLSSQTLEANAVPGLYFIGEVVDVTGWLGGYNFQWAWASAHACACSLPHAAP